MTCSGLLLCCASLSVTLTAGCSSDQGDRTASDAAVPRPASTRNGLAVLGSDGVSSTLSILDADGNLVKDGCFASATGALPLSADAVLPSQVPAGGSVIVIDRASAVLTWLDPATCTATRQLSVSTGFAAQPHDVAVWSANKAYVTRAGGNPTPTPTPSDFDDGDDVLVLDTGTDPGRPAIVGRIDLEPFAATDGTDILPRADRALVAEGRVFVSLNQISGDAKRYGSGRIVAIDPATDQVVAAVDLPGLKDCGAMTYVAATKSLLVACNGAASDGPQQAASSAVAAIDVSLASPVLITTVPASAVGNLPFSAVSLAALDPRTVLAVTRGNSSALPGDRLWALSFAGDKPSMVFESSEGFALGGLVADPATGWAFLADATTRTPAFLRTFDATATGWVVGLAITTDPARKLPPRGLATY